MIAFVSGHRDVTVAEFEEHYKPQLIKAMADGHKIVVGDYQGADHRAQAFLAYHGYENVLVYHMFVKPRYFVNGFNTIGGFTSDEERDSAMTYASDYDIAWVRQGKENSGTAININRRKIKNGQ